MLIVRYEGVKKKTKRRTNPKFCQKSVSPESRKGRSELQDGVIKTSNKGGKENEG